MLNRSIPGGQGELEKGISTIKTAWAKTEVGENKSCWETVRCPMSAYKVKSGRKPGWRVSQGQAVKVLKSKLRNLESILKAPGNHQEFLLKRNGMV